MSSIGIGIGLSRQEINERLKEVNINNENVIQNQNVINSYDYFESLNPNDIKIIKDYRGDPECDNWELERDNEYYPNISYKIINWLLKRNIEPNYTYIPDDLYCNHITNNEILMDQINEQINNAEIMNNALLRFPVIEGEGINVFRGSTTSFLNSFKKTRSHNLNSFSEFVTLPSFLSTALFIEAAQRFAQTNDILAIHIRSGDILPYVYPNLNKYSEPDYGGNVYVSESEVIFPVRTVLQYNGSSTINDTNFHFYTFVKVLDTREYWNNFKLRINNMFSDESLWNKIVERRVQEGEGDQMDIENNNDGEGDNGDNGIGEFAIETNISGGSINKKSRRNSRRNNKSKNRSKKNRKNSRRNIKNKSKNRNKSRRKND
jgi:hypothetical protein